MQYSDTPQAGDRLGFVTRLFANLFLLFFIFDGCLSSLDEVVALFHPLTGLTAVRNVIANAAILLSIPVYVGVGLDKRLPKRVFLPLIAFAWLCPMLTSLFPSLNVTGTGFVTAALQVLLFLLVTTPYWKSDKPGFMIPDAIFHGPWFSWKNSAAFAAANVLVLPCLLALLVLSSVNAYLQQYTAGFMHLSPKGLHMSEKVYRKGDKWVRLVSMIHVGEKQYYEKVLQRQFPGRTIVLAEGVTDNRRLLRNHLDYGRFAGYLGLSSQRDEMLLKGRTIEASDLEESAGKEPATAKGDLPDILRADVDVSSFRPTTIRFLDELGRQMKKGASVREQMLGSVLWWQKNATPQLEESIFDDILHRRNRELIGHLQAALRLYDVVVIPWGAMHMPEIEEEVKAQGFQLQQVHDSVSVHFDNSHR